MVPFYFLSLGWSEMTQGVFLNHGYVYVLVLLGDMNWNV